MFELLGYYVLRALGWGWLWSREHARDYFRYGNTVADSPEFATIGFTAASLAVGLLGLYVYYTN